MQTPWCIPRPRQHGRRALPEQRFRAVSNPGWSFDPVYSNLVGRYATVQPGCSAPGPAPPKESEAAIEMTGQPKWQASMDKGMWLPGHDDLAISFWGPMTGMQ